LGRIEPQSRDISRTGAVPSHRRNGPDNERTAEASPIQPKTERCRKTGEARVRFTSNRVTEYLAYSTTFRCIQISNLIIEIQRSTRLPINCGIEGSRG